MAQLLEVRVETPLSEPNTNTVQPKPAATAKEKTQRAVAPALNPPTLRLSSEIYEIHQIADFFAELDDSDLLTTSRAVRIP